MTTSRVTPYDATFTYAESERVRSSIVTAYAFAESSAASTELVDQVARRAAAVLRLRQRMVRAHLDIGDAYWTEVPNFDARTHIETCPSMGWERLVRFMTDLHELDFDHDRPLWRVYIVRDVIGVEPTGRPCTVVVLRFHHSMADGMGVASIARSLFEETLAPPAPPTDSVPVSRGKITAIEFARGFIRPFMIVADLWRLVTVSRRAAKDRKAGVWTMPDAQPRATVVNQPCGPDRDSAIVFESVSKVRRVAHSIGSMSVNDVVLSVIGRSMAAHLGEPEQPLAASVPISVRDLVEPDMRNALGFGTVELSPELPFDEQVRAVHHRVRSERSRLNLPTFAAMYSVLPRLPGFAYRLLYRRGQAREARGPKPGPTQLRISTIPKGPSHSWTFAGQPGVACFGVTPVSDGLGVNHTVSTFGDNLAIGIMADPAQLHDLDGYVATLRANLEEVIASYGRSA
ncbi:WS/DGAT domain-containing protein [Gordonia sp. HY442]|uniref:wax ester/triacylglycerol synthase domain-containing protein n=1 Tax=Gordonia zhenghanii TaxID=2911516 RepID=UPI001F004D49|nr:wax ester/triacylglycerol synthase domain-containing protein [Gordonia zhenghanii]MCF8607791.1 WS/DGAT domain-containing protein [Gordonia zhenghanii]